MKARYAPEEPPAASPEAPSVVYGRSSLFARVAGWLIVSLYVAGTCIFLWLERRLNLQDENPMEGVMIIAGFGAFAVVGALLAAKRPANPIGWIMAAVALMVGLFPAGDAYAAYMMTVRGRPDALAVLGAWIQSWYWLLLLGLMFVYLPLLFPDGRLPSRRWLPIALLAGAGTLSLVVLGMLTGTLTGQDVDYRIDNPIGIEGLAHVEDLPVFGVLGGLLGIGALGAVAAVMVRFRRSRGIERQQIKWFLYAVAPLMLLPVLDYVPEIVGSVMFGWVLIALPTAIGIAILKYRLYDIDLVINRTLVYGTLTAGVVGIYVFVVVYLGAVFRTGGNLTISLVATGIVAVLFAPLRDRLQRAVNRLMYGERDEPYAAVSRLGERMAATLAPDAVLPTIVETVREALKLPYAAIALPRDGGFEVAAVSGGEQPATPLVLPLSYGGETVGRLLLAPRAPGEGFSADDRRLLDDLARHAGVAVHGVRVMTDLRRSREGLVLAREEERRRLRRDLHDELAPTLAALGLTAATVGELISADPKKAASANEKLRSAIRATIGDVRRLVYDLRPPALDDLGLVVAIRERASHLEAGEGLRVTVEAPEELPALPAAVEVVAYRIVQEALTNVSRHARAGACFVRLACTGSPGRALTVEVTDDGVSLPDEPGGGVGLHSMRERATELGGSCEIERSLPIGTRVFARLPIEASVLRQQESRRSKGREADA